MHCFYETRNLSLEEKIEILNWAKERSKSISIEKLNCKISFCREPLDMSFEDITKDISNSRFYIINRDNYTTSERYLEISFCKNVFIDNDYEEHMLWIFLDISYLDELINKYNLKLLNGK